MKDVGSVQATKKAESGKPKKKKTKKQVLWGASKEALAPTNPNPSTSTRPAKHAQADTQARAGALAASKSDRLLDAVTFQHPTAASAASSWERPEHGVPWQRFASFQEAAAFADGAASRNEEPLAVVAEEVGNNGARSFLAVTWEAFWHTYCRLPGERCFYEVVREGQVCRLFVDVEFKIPEHADPALAIKRGDRLVARLAHALRRLLDQHFASPAGGGGGGRGGGEKEGGGGEGGEREEEGGGWAWREEGWLLELEGSTSSKFSRHLIAPEVVMSDAVALGALLKAGRGGMAEEVAAVVDWGVYTRNRNFRLLGSTKRGKAAPLTVCTRSLVRGGRAERAVREGGGARDKARRLFFLSLISHIPPHPPPRILRPRPPTLPRLPAPPAGLLPLTRARTHATPHTAPSSSSSAAAGYDAWGAGPRGGGSGFRREVPPELEALAGWVCSVVRPGASVRSWAGARASRSVVLDLNHNRFCERMQRGHKANRVLVVCNLEAGAWYHKCQDPECRAVNFRSPPRPIPPHIWGSFDWRTLP